MSAGSRTIRREGAVRHRRRIGDRRAGRDPVHGAGRTGRRSSTSPPSGPQEAAAAIDGAIGLGADVADEASVKAAIDATVEQLGRIDCVLNAAGYADFGPLEDYSYERWQRMMNVHAGGTFLVCKHALPALKVNGGSIVNIASTAAIVAQPNNYAYGAAKAAIAGFSRQIALDLAPDNIRVNTVAPGRAKSGITTPLYTSRGGGSFEEGARISAQGVMQKRIAEAVEIANVITFLLSRRGQFRDRRALRGRRRGDLIVNTDVIVVGAGVGGLVDGGLLAKEGKRVTLLEKQSYLGGRAMEHRYRGHQIGLGSHLVEDPGDSLTRACE